MGNRYDENTLPADVSHLRLATEDTASAPHIVVLTGPCVGSLFRVSGEESTIGRSNECDIHIDDESISREHAKLVRTDDGGFLIKDMGSTNGTYKSGQRIDTAVLAEGERFRIGSTTLLRLSLNVEMEASFRKLYDASVRDPLTGLHNRRHLDERLEAELSFSTRHGTPLSLIFLDIDHFKKVNDSQGHQAGDHVLRKLSEVLQSSVRAEDLVARFGGEEFVILAPGITSDQAQTFAERIRLAIEQLELTYEEGQISITVSVGVACSSQASPSDAPSDLLKAGDRALFEAKRRGRNQVAVSS